MEQSTSRYYHHKTHNIPNTKKIPLKGDNPRKTVRKATHSFWTFIHSSLPHLRTFIHIQKDGSQKHTIRTSLILQSEGRRAYR